MRTCLTLGELSTTVRLLFVTQDFPPHVGGIQRYASELSRALAPRCRDFLLLAPASAGAGDLDRALDYPVLRLAVSSDAMPAAAALAVPVLTRRRRFDVCLHAQWPTAPAGLAARRLGTLSRVAIAAHGRELLLRPFERLRPVQLAYDRGRARVLATADRVLAVSRFTAAHVADLSGAPNRVRCVPNGVDIERFSAGERATARRRFGLGERPLLFTLARLVPRKGIDTVLHALPRVRELAGDVEYVIGGTGPDAARLRALSEQLGLGDRVRFVGDVPETDVAHWYAACDAFVMPARSDGPNVEGFGLVFLEAGACGRPVIGARAGGVVDAIIDGETGLLVAPDDPAALAHAVARLVSDRELAARLGRAGRARAETLSWSRVAERVLAALDEP